MRVMGAEERLDEPTEADASFQALVREQLRQLGEDPDREGLLKTPERVEKSLKWLTRGSGLRVEDVIGDAIFDEDHHNMVLVKDIEMYSLCEHHMLPFFGKVHIAYIPNGKIVGLSKLPRVVEVFARRLQVQERLTEQIAQGVMDVLEPAGGGRGGGGGPPLHDDARGGEAELQDAHQRHEGRVPRGPPHPRGVPPALHGPLRPMSDPRRTAPRRGTRATRSAGGRPW